MDYSLGLYEKAIPSGLSFREMFEITKECGFDRLEISIDETDARLSRLDLPAEEVRALGALSRQYNVPIRTMCLSGHRKYPFGSHDADIRKRSMEIMRKARAVHFPAVRRSISPRTQVFPSSSWPDMTCITKKVTRIRKNGSVRI